MLLPLHQFLIVFLYIEGIIFELEHHNQDLIQGFMVVTIAELLLELYLDNGMVGMNSTYILLIGATFVYCCSWSLILCQ